MKILTSCVLLIFLLLHSCCRSSSQLEEALIAAKDNRQELEKVLFHYEHDSLKLKSAEFLIRNMPAHNSYVGEGINKYYDAVDSILNLGIGIWEKRDALDKMTPNYISVFKTASDVDIITADFLISNIDTAFSLWKNGEWATHVSFDDFCEYLLPYKSLELQILDNWREYLKNKYGNSLKNLHYCDMYKNSAIWAAHIINTNLKNEISPYLLEYHIPSIQRMSSKVHTSFGSCHDYVQIADAVLKSVGIPAAIDFTPQWPFRGLGHYWNVVLANNGKCVPFDGADSNPGESFHLDEKMAKVYRITYAINLELDKLLKTEPFVPEVFNSPCLRDVTAEYMKTVDIAVKVNQRDSKYAYLAVFNNHNWAPVSFGKIENGKAFFNDLGTDIVYLPVCYGKTGIEPVGDPFLLTSRGEINKFRPDNNALQSMSLYRKYPLFKHVYNVADRIVEGEFQASDNELFRNATVMHKIENWGTRGEEVLLPSSPQAYRYWRYFHPWVTFCNIAEIAFVERDSHQVIRGKIIGTEGSWANDPKNCKGAAFDGDLLTWFDAPAPTEGWVGMDFGRPVSIEKIIYTPRGDGNTIEIGDEYELFYWGDNQWNSLGRQIATTVRLEYEDIPSGTLYLLRDLTKGKEERIFEYKERKQQFW